VSLEPPDDDRGEVGEHSERDKHHGSRRGQDRQAMAVDPELQRDAAAGDGSGSQHGTEDNQCPQKPIRRLSSPLSLESPRRRGDLFATVKPALMRRMPRKRKKSVLHGKAAAVATVPAGAPRDLGGGIAAAALLLSIAAAGLLVDLGADASFDAPKRLTTLAFVAAATLAAFGFCRWSNPLPRLTSGRFTIPGVAALLFLAAAAAALVAALASPRRALSLDTTRALFLYALLLPLGASRVLEKNKALLLAGFLSITAVNAVISMLQARNSYQPFQLVTRGNREATGAFVGNPGSLALVLTLASVASIGLALSSSEGFALRAACGLTAVVFVAGLLVNRNLTSWSALVAGTGILLLARFGRRAAMPLLLLVLLGGAGILAYHPMRYRAREALSAVRDRDWDRLVTYRLGAWAAASEMAKERPWTGFGPGTYGAELVPHRLRAEIRMRQRLANPLLTSSYSEAHCDYLQFFAEAGVPAGLALLAAVLLLFRGLLAAARRLQGRARSEAVLLLAFLGAGAVAALTWFPLQRPLSGVPLLLAAGRAWRISTESSVSPEKER
jgi:O-antigen ligase